MKKKIIALALMVGLLCGCADTGTPNAGMVAKDGYYNWTPQSIIDGLNGAIEERGDSRYHKIPDYISSGNEMHIVNRLYVTFYSNEDGALTKVELDLGERNSLNEDAKKTAQCIFYTLVATISPGDEYDRVCDVLDIDINSYGDDTYTTTVTSNGTRYTYQKVGDLSQHFTIEPAE